MILVNFKVYTQTFNEGAIKLAKICKEVMEETGVKIIPVVSSLDAHRIINELKINVYIQHIDAITDGPKTGFISGQQAKELGVKGSLINHSEHKLKPGTIKNILTIIPKNFDSVVCLNSLGQAESWARNIKPSMIAYEPSYLIGNKEKSVATDRPDVIKKMVEKFKNVPVLVGAGIKDADDVRISLDLGAKGVLISSAIVTAKDPKVELLKLCQPFKK
jgi:triosephosphate isomerase